MICRLFRKRYAERVDGARAASWEVGYFTKDRKDLPYPPPKS